MEKNQILYRKTLTGEDRVYFAIEGFGKSSDDYKIHIDNKNVHAGMTISGDRPLAKIVALVHSFGNRGRTIYRYIARAWQPFDVEIRL